MLETLNRWTARAAAILAAVIVLGLIGLGGWIYYRSHRTVFDLLRESKELRKAIANLTAESSIGYAKVVAQRVEDGRTVSDILFVVTARDNPSDRLLERQVTVPGDTIHFDALIVKFPDDLVKDGRARALYLWRRIYGETTPPEQGAPIETPGAEPERYREVFALVPPKDRALFWSEIWQLANDPQRLRKAGITAIYGNALYQKLKPGLIYTFKLGHTGEFYIETSPAL